MPSHKMADNELSRRKALKSTVSALALEKGFQAIEKNALETLTELIQSCISEIGHNAHLYAELAGRYHPTLTDVEVALSDVGLSLAGIEQYAKRQERRHLPKQVNTQAQATPKGFQTSAKASRPPNVPDHLPALPDPHTFQRTPCFPKPTSDYQELRERMALQMKESRQSLSRLLAKTRPSRPILGTEDSSGNYTVIEPEMPKEPMFIRAVLPSQEDFQETEKEDNPIDGNSREELDMDTSLGTLQEESTTEECPYLKPPKRTKLQQ